MRLSKTLPKIEEAIKDKIISTKKLTSGGHHDTYLIKTKKGKYILKLGREDYLNREYNFLKKIPKGIAPKPIHLSKKEPIFFIQECVEGKHPKKIDNNLIKEISKTYKKLHSNKTSNIPKEEKHLIYSLFYWLNRYETKIKEFSIPLKIKSRLNEIFEDLKILIKKYDKSFSNRKNFSLCHNDADISNIFISDRGIKFIDWEFSGYWLHERDLINFIKSNRLNNKQQKLFFKEYDYKISKKFYALFIMFLLSDINYLLSYKKRDYKKINRIINKINLISLKLK